MESVEPSYSEASETEVLDFPSLGERLRRALLSFAVRIDLDLWFVAILAISLLVTLWGHRASIRFAQASVLYPIGMMVFLLLSRLALWGYRHFKGQNGALSMGRVCLQTLRDWTPFIVIDFIYENLHDLSQYFYLHRDIAGTLMAWDIALFGVEPVLWSQRFFHPLLTDYMAFAYALYFILPLFTMYLLAFRDRRGELKEMILALSLTFLLGFVGYVFLPCSPPRYFLESGVFEPVQLYGRFLYDHLQAKWDNLSAIRSGAFPSLHVGISTVALIYALRFRRWSRFDYGLSLVYAVLIVSLWLSTVYLRHHWFIDIAAGWGIALFSAVSARFLIAQWEKLRMATKIAPEMT